MSRVVTVTSIALERDSRSLKFAASAARLGHESIVVEGERSTLLADDLPIELISPPEPGPEASTRADGAPTDAEPEGSDAGEGPVPRRVLLGRRLPRFVAAPIKSLLRLSPRNFLLTVRGYVAYFRQRNRETEAMLPDGDVYWLHGFWQYTAVRRKAKQLGARFLYDTPDAYWEPGQTIAVDRGTRVAMRIYEAIEKRCIRRAEAFSSVGVGVAGLLERRFGRRPVVIRNFQDLRLDRAPERELRADCGAGPDQFLMVMVGNRKPGTTVAEGLEALRRLPDRVGIAFLGRNWDDVRELAAEMGLSERVHFPDPVAPTEVSGYIRGADAAPVLYRAASTNYLYCLPNGLFHAVAAGIPVLYPQLPEIQALAAEHELGVEMDADDPDSIAAAVRTLLDDPALLARFRRSIAAAREKLNWEQEERKLAEILAGTD